MNRNQNAKDVNTKDVDYEGYKNSKVKRNLSNISLAEAIKLSSTIKPLIQIGKNGLTENVILELDKNLKTKKLVKVKCLKYFLDSIEKECSNKDKLKDIAQLLEKKTNSIVISQIGFMLVFWKKNG